jgi:hypothetical protein
MPHPLQAESTIHEIPQWRTGLKVHVFKDTWCKVLGDALTSSRPIACHKDQMQFITFWYPSDTRRIRTENIVSVYWFLDGFWNINRV